MMEPRISEKELIDKLTETLRQLPQARATLARKEPHSATRDFRYDADIGFSVGEEGFRLLVEIKKSLYPRDVRESLWQIKKFVLSEQPNDNRSVVPLLAAESISPGAKDLLRQESVGYFDSGGSLYVPARRAFIYIEKPPPKTFSKSVRSLFKGKRAQVLHALLLHSERWFSVKSLAELAEVSPATTSETLSSLDRFEWMSSQGQGPSKKRRLSDPSALLDEWAKQASMQRLAFRPYYVPLADLDTLVEKLDRTFGNENADYVLTQEIAAQHYAPYLTSVSRVKCRIAPGRASAEAISELGARGASEGSNLLVLQSKSENAFLFKKRIGNAWLASPIQVYLDLLRSGGRSKEMAEHLRKEVIGF